MMVAGEASGDLLAAELVVALRALVGDDVRSRSPADVLSQDQQPLRAPLDPRFFGAGGSRMAAAGVELAFDLTEHSVVGISGVMRSLLKFRRLFRALLQLALDRQPDLIICVDFSGFNRRFAAAVRRAARARAGIFKNWQPKIVQYVSPQVWASRESRVHQIARDYDLVLCIFPFEKAWYAQRAPGLRVEFVGHPMVERFALLPGSSEKRGAPPFSSINHQPSTTSNSQPSTLNSPNQLSTLNPQHVQIVLLPGSRPGELRRHVPIVISVARKIGERLPAKFTLVFPSEELARQFEPGTHDAPGIAVQIGNAEAALRGADLAITKSGTITMECAFLGVPAVVFYQTSALNYWIARRIVKVKYLAMPNLLAGEPVFPEFIQNAATPEAIADAAIGLLRDGDERQRVKNRLAEIVATLGTPGAARRAAKAILELT